MANHLMNMNLKRFATQTVCLEILKRKLIRRIFVVIERPNDVEKYYTLSKRSK